MTKLAIESLRADAKFFRAAADTMPEAYNKTLAREDYKIFLKQKIKNSTRANIAMNELYKSHPISFPICYDLHIRELEKLPDVDELIKESETKIRKIYPKTAGLRERLIKADRVVFEEVKPALKGLKKELLKLRVLF